MFLWCCALLVQPKPSQRGANHHLKKKSQSEGLSQVLQGTSRWVDQSDSWVGFLAGAWLGAAPCDIRAAVGCQGGARGSPSAPACCNFQCGLVQRLPWRLTGMAMQSCACKINPKGDSDIKTRHHVAWRLGLKRWHGSTCLPCRGACKPSSWDRISLHHGAAHAPMHYECPGEV